MKALPCGGAHRFLGRRPFVPWGGSPASLSFSGLLPWQHPACYWSSSARETLEQSSTLLDRQKYHILKLHAADLSLPCLLQGRNESACCEAPLRHSSFLSSAGCCSDTASGDTLRQSTRVEEGPRWTFKDTLHTDMHMSSRRWRDGACGRHHSVHDNCSTTCSQADARATTKRVPWPSLPRPPKGGQGRLFT